MSNQKKQILMRKFLTVLLAAAVCTAAMGQNIKDSIWGEVQKPDFGDSKWDVGVTMSFMYNHTLGAPSGLSSSGFGMEIAPLEMQWKGWRGGAITLGILDMFFDWQYLVKGHSFADVHGTIVPALDGKGDRFDFSLGFPVGLSQQFSSRFGISISAVPGIGIYRYKNEYIALGARHNDKFFPLEKRAGFRLNLKATLWYSDFGIVFRYQPLASPDLNTTMFSVGISLRG